MAACDCASFVANAVLDDRVERVGYGQMRLTDVQFSDHGLYTVVASDLYSNSSVSFSLFVNGMHTFNRSSYFTLTEHLKKNIPAEKTPPKHSGLHESAFRLIRYDTLRYNRKC